MKKWIIIVSVVLAVSALVGLAIGISKEGPRTVEVRKGSMVEAVYAIGTVRADRVFNSKVGVTAKMLERYVRQGDLVKKGQKLVQLEGFSTIVSPFDGIVTTMAFEKGELVFAQAIIVTVVDTSSYFIEISVDERTIPSIRAGQTADISFEGARNVEIIGKVRSVYSSNGDFLVAIDADLSKISLLQGMTSDVAVKIKEYKDEILVPLGAIDKDNQIKIIQNGKETIETVKIVAKNSKYAILTSTDLKEGSRVVIERAMGSGASGAGGPPGGGPRP